MLRKADDTSAGIEMIDNCETRANARRLAHLRCDAGGTAIEYALIGAGVALAIAPLMPVFSAAFRAAYTTIAGALL